jgi:hypothetical protein
MTGRYIYTIDSEILQKIPGLSDIVSVVIKSELNGSSYSNTFITGEGVSLFAACLLFSKSNISLGNNIFIAEGGGQRHTHRQKITRRSDSFRLFRSPAGIAQAYCSFAWILRQDMRKENGSMFCFKRVYLSNRADKLIPGVYILFFVYDDGIIRAELVYIPTEGYNEDCLRSTINFLKNGGRNEDIRILFNMENHFIELLNE